MNLDNLKPAWQQFRLLNSMHSIDENEILLIIEHTDEMNVSKIHRYLICSVIFAVLVICCHGG
jgi:hypothetical protein